MKKKLYLPCAAEIILLHENDVLTSSPGAPKPSEHELTPEIYD